MEDLDPLLALLRSGRDHSKEAAIAVTLFEALIRRAGSTASDRRRTVRHLRELRRTAFLSIGFGC